MSCLGQGVVEINRKEIEKEGDVGIILTPSLLPADSLTKIAGGFPPSNLSELHFFIK